MISRKAWAAKPSRWPAIIFSAALLLAAPVRAEPAAEAAAPAPVESPGKNLQTMLYEVYAGGINAVTAKLDVAYETQDRYRMALMAKTKGFLGSIVPWSGTFETWGWRLGEKDMPELHKSTAIWKGEQDLKEYHYGKDGTFQSLKAIEAGEDVTPEKLEAELTQGTTDVLTATLEIMKAIAAGGKCEGSSEVFDGSRRFELLFVHEANEILEATEYNAYAGPAARCTVEVRPIAGEWHSKPRGWMSIQEQGREKGTMPTVWMASIDGQAPAVPVKVRVKTDYGTLFMHLIGYRNGVKEIKAAEEE